MTSVSAIYEIYNTESGCKYIGSSADCHHRWKFHLSKLNTNHHPNVHLQRAWNKYGYESFRIKILFMCDKKDLLLFEQRTINVIKPAYNILPIAGSPLGYRHTIAAIEKIRNSGLGRKHSEETKHKMSEAHKGRLRSPEHVLHLAEAHRHGTFSGHTHSPESIKKMSDIKLEWWKNRKESKTCLI